MASTKEEALASGGALRGSVSMSNDEACKKLVTAFRGTSFVPVMAAAALGLTNAETLVVLKELHEIGCCGCPVNDGGRKLYTMTPQVVRDNNGV